MTQMKIKHFAIYTNNVDSLSLNPEKYKSCLTVAAGEIILLFWPVHKHMYIFTHLWWLYIHLIGDGGSDLKKKKGEKTGVIENEIHKC